MVPVGLALVGSGFDRPTVAFVGWFGPRGLASVVFGLIAVDALAPDAAKVVLAAVTVTRAGRRLGLDNLLAKRAVPGFRYDGSIPQALALAT